MKRLAFLSMAAAGAFWALMVACSSDSGSTFNENQEDGAVDGGFLFGDGSAVNPTVTCTTALPTNFSPTYLAPSASDGQCSTDQIGAYFDACLAVTGSVDACTAFRTATANAECTACIEPDGGTGPIQTYASHKYSQLNRGGCVAIEQGNVADGGACALALQASDQCQVASCLACIEKTSVSNAAIDDCKAQSRTRGCATYLSAISSACPVGYTGPDGGAYDCFPHDTEQTTDQRSWIRRVMGVYCGPSRAP